MTLASAFDLNCWFLVILLLKNILILIQKNIEELDQKVLKQKVNTQTCKITIIDLSSSDLNVLCLRKNSKIVSQAIQRCQLALVH